jgi:N-acetylmuramic acid 6-phosphate etherase
LVQGIIAGGRDALIRSREGVEDDADAGAKAIDEVLAGNNDVVIGIAASGTTPYVHAALARAKERGARTGFITCSDPPDSIAAISDETIVVRVGPEALTGSTRLKAGTATKLILNTITTGAMIRAGKAYGNLMVDLMATSNKLIDRGQRIVMEACGVDRAKARTAIEEASGSVKLAIVMVCRALDAAEARRLLDQSGGGVRTVVGDPPPV